LSEFDRIVSGILALFIGVILFIAVLPSILIASGLSSIFSYLIGFILLLVLFFGFVRMILE